MTERLRDRWWTDLGRAWAVTGGPGGDRDAADVAYDRIATAYGEPIRRYHTLEHITAVLDVVDDLGAAVEVDPGAADAAGIHLAAWLHDVVYDPTRGDNEARSAQLARALLADLGVADEVIVGAARLIELTATHAVADDDRAGAVLIDADLSILGAPHEVYLHYARCIRGEYGHLSDDTYRDGRIVVLETFAGRDPIFRTAEGRRRFERPAHRNLHAELAELRAGVVAGP
jgi:predicted metal-dependent HD superfamily phosphohydrolase